MCKELPSFPKNIAMSQIATHDGIVKLVEPGKIVVEMHVLSACSQCKGHASCSFVDKADKLVEIETPEWEVYAVGDRVIVSVNESLGLVAVLFAYILPAVILVVSVIMLSVLTESEVLAAVIPLLLVVVYFFILYQYRTKLQRRFTFGIERA